jgi:hypothetical protein
MSRTTTAPTGRRFRHFAFVKVLPPRNYEIYLGDLESGQRNIPDSYTGALQENAGEGVPEAVGRWLGGPFPT